MDSPKGQCNDILKLMKVLHTQFAVWMICLSLLMAAGCAQLQGKSVKTYQLEYKAAVQASADALKELEIYILNSETDELRTTILARRGNGTPVTVEVKRIDPNFTRVAVGTGTGVGLYLDRDVSVQIHAYIRKQLVKPSTGIKWPEP